MPVYLDEDYIGEDPQEIAYPHLLLCMGVTCLLDNGRLIGVHLTSVTSEDDMLRELKRRIDSDPGRPRALYITGDLAKHDRHGGKMPANKARALGYTGPISVYDTGTLNPTDGTFVRVVSNGVGQDATVFAMLDEVARPYSVRMGCAGEIVKRLGDGSFRPPNMTKTGTHAPSPAPLAAGAFMVLQAH